MIQKSIKPRNYSKDEQFRQKAKTQYCFVTAVENVEDIVKNGLKANEDGYIFFFKDGIVKAPYCGIWRLDVDNETARREKLTGKFAKFIITPYREAIRGWVDRGIGYGLIRDNEYAVKQDFIKPEYLVFEGIHDYVNQATPDYQEYWGKLINYNAN